MRLLKILAILILLIPSTACTERTKEPAVAGVFYPADKEALKNAVAGYLSKAEFRPVNGDLISLVVPHAGYMYSGQIAAHSYSHLKGRDTDTVILIGSSHHAMYKGISVYTEGGFRTPLGRVKINEKMAKSLLNEKANISFYEAPFEKEHSLEVQLPFLQETLQDFRIVPILLGSPTQESFDFLREKLTEILRDNPRTVIIASTDLSHYHDYEAAVKKDRKIIDAIERISIEDAEQALRLGDGEMCGGYAVLLSMSVARNLGATNGVLYKYANSGDVTSDRSRVVGYAAIGFYKTQLTEDERKELLALAKNAIISYVKDKKVPEFTPSQQRLKANGAVFVTINRHGQLRGCIGSIHPIMPLYKSVINNAVSASSRDPRFPPITVAELADMEVEVTVLTPLEPLKNTDRITVGKHGLYLIKGNNSGIFLPQVPIEQKWNLNAYLENLSLKAGLPKDEWKSSTLYTFTADIIK